MKILSTLDTRGDFGVYLVYPDGRRELFYEKKNLIVLSGKQSIITQLYTAGVISDPIANLKVGTGGTSDPNGQYPKTELSSQTNLYSPQLTVAVTPSPDLTNTQVTFLADIGQSVGNGLRISEAGLFRSSGTLFSVKNHPAIPKTADFSIHYEWIIRCL